MANVSNLIVEEANPSETWEALKTNPSAILVDVRTIAEWDYVGEPSIGALGKELLKVEWMEYPEMMDNEYFAEELLAQIGDDLPEAIYFICRSGVRSKAAAESILAKLAGTGRVVKCVNVTEGFEGVQDQNAHRGKINGWKKHGLPWRQP